MKFGKKGKTDPLVIVIIALVALYFFGVFDKEVAVPGTTTVVSKCVYEPTMTVGPMQKRYAATTSMSDEYARVFVGGVDKGLKQDGTTLAVGFDADVEIYYAENSTSYYAAKQTFKVPCTSAFSSADESLDGEAFMVYEMDLSDNLSAKCFNTDGDKIVLGTAQAIGIGDVDSLNCEIKGNFEDAYSPYAPIIATVAWNSTSMDKVRLLDEDGNEFPTATVPIHRSNAISGLADVSAHSLKAYEMPSIISGQRVEYLTWYDADDTLNPAAPGANITIWFDDQDWYKNADTGKMELGPSNADDADVGSTAQMKQIVGIS